MVIATSHTTMHGSMNVKAKSEFTIGLRRMAMRRVHLFVSDAHKALLKFSALLICGAAVAVEKQ